ncbi:MULTISPECIES: hypothetical protein [Streptomyces]|uniref:Uncharacterized protein n=1 Tax=Streptomyces lannensis TaxID=766498 RepID=A0ABP7LDE1_9ACTN|nr:hypothetical protein [Streptomyces sp. NRRL F-5122]KUJ58438.1 hypothetical protein ADL25_03265 [Streptomyces sp. NRRL F-5122]
MDAERSALTTLCQEFDALISETGLHSAQRQELLERIVAEARARHPVLSLLSQLLNTDRETTLRTLATGLPGAGPGTAREEAFRCPDGACDRTAVPPPAGAIPRCAVLGRLMERR